MCVTKLCEHVFRDSPLIRKDVDHVEIRGHGAPPETLAIQTFHLSEAEVMLMSSSDHNSQPTKETNLIDIVWDLMIKIFNPPRKNKT